MDWVWTRSAAKGTARMILLAIADKCSGPECTAYAGTAMLVQRTNASRRCVVGAVDKLLASGELAVVEGRKGPRGETVYRLAGAVGHARAMSSDRPRIGGADSAPVPNLHGCESCTPGGAGSATEGCENCTPRGVESAPQNARERKHQEEQQQPRARALSASVVTEALRPLAAALDAAGVGVRWSLGLGEQEAVWRLVQRHGVSALVELAVHRTVPGEAPRSARYWLKVWSDLDHLSPAGPGATVVPFRGRATTAPAASARQNLLAALDNLENRENAR
ncbi:hypothetical protein [Streptomyces thioluteus]